MLGKGISLLFGLLLIFPIISAGGYSPSLGYSLGGDSGLLVSDFPLNVSNFIGYPSSQQFSGVPATYTNTTIIQPVAQQRTYKLYNLAPVIELLLTFLIIIFFIILFLRRTKVRFTRTTENYKIGDVHKFFRRRAKNYVKNGFAVYAD